LVGKIARNQVPYFKFRVPSEASTASTESQEAQAGVQPSAIGSQRLALKSLGAAMAASGAVALYHVEGVTPEADQPGIIAPGAETLVVESLADGYAMLDSDGGDDIDLVWIGCPHASPAELAQVVELLAGRWVRARLWVTMAREVRAEAARAGTVAALEALGGQAMADTCLVVAPIKELGFRRMATPSGKGAYYAPTQSGLAVRYGSVEACIEAAVTGRWPSESK
jgi:predicted aconitase